MEKIYLIDAFALIFKFYYAFIGRPMRNRDGLNTSAIYGFTRFINDIVSHRRPGYLGVAFDPPGGNFRHELFPAYKANRGDTPEDIIKSVPYIKRIMEAMRIPCLEVPGYEADDVIGTVAMKAADEGFEVYMVTPDKDYGQLLRDNCYMYKPGKSGSGVEIVSGRNICDNYGFASPSQVIDLLALWGDSSDNVPGVPGIGEKSAVKLINEFGGVDGILDNIDRLKGKQRENIEAGRQQLLLSRRLVTIRTDVPIEFVPERLAVEEPLYDVLREIYVELGFGSLLKDLDLWEREAKAGGATPLPDETFTGMTRPPALERGQVKENTPAPSLFGGAAASLFDGGQMSDIRTTEHKYLTLGDVTAVSQLAAVLSTKEAFAFDTETSSLDMLHTSLVGISIAVEPHKAYYIVLDPHDRDRTLAMLAPLKPLLESDNIVKIGQNIRFDLHVLSLYGINVGGRLIDTMIVHYLLESHERHGMDYLAEKYLGYRTVHIEELIGSGASQRSMADVDVAVVAEYAAEDADITLQLKEVLWRRLEEEGLVGLYLEVEEPLIRVLADMERTGVRVDAAALAEYAVHLKGELSAIEDKIYSIAGDSSLNINSARQLGELLFEKLKIDPKPKMTKTKQYRTDEEYLVSLQSRHEIVGLILEYRGVRKLLSTYVEALPKLIDPATGRIHTTYNQTVTTTGRLSSANPNLQNIPIRDEQGRHIRKAFIAEGDNLLLSADYSQIELRIMAHLSGDEALCEAFRQGEDIHAATAAKIFGKSVSEVTSEERRRAKTANFGIIYGISSFGLSSRLDISRVESKELIDGYFASYPAVKSYMDYSVAQARAKGYAETMFGRRNYLPDITSSNSVVRGFAERNAINSPIQGSAADIIKIAMNRLYARLGQEGLRSKIILQVHDELILEVPPHEIERVKLLVKETMEGAVELSVPLEVEQGTGKTWLDAH
ncbi:MAG: DNA polymerase I [Rikenellaceae bacterium]|nr:DNA polymerase I [Rikenellaceae bacterium]